MSSIIALLVHHTPTLLGDDEDRYLADGITIYGCMVDAWLQYWLAYPGDRDHIGTDWEMVMLKLDGGTPVAAVYAQHRWCRARAWSLVEREGASPVVYVGRDKHASYFRKGWHRHGRHLERSNGRVRVPTELQIEVPEKIRKRIQHLKPDLWINERLRGWRPRVLR